MNGGVLDDMLSLSRTTGHGAIFGFAGYSGSGKTTLLQNEDGKTCIDLHGRKGAGLISSLTGADDLVEIPI